MIRTPRLLLTALAAPLLLAACGDPGANTSESTRVTRPYGSLAFEPCTLGGSSGAGNVEAQCARLDVPEDRATPGGRTISVHVAWLPAGRNAAANEDPVFFLAGGPGQAASDVAGVVDSALREVRKQRDIFLVDQRGTGKSNPLTCVDAAGKELPLDELAEPSVEVLRDYARRCAAGLQGKADPRFYTTTEAVADLDAVRTALGVEQVNLVGGSYGTRVAQQYATRHPQHTRTVVLDGVVPNDLVVGGEFASTFEDALALQSAQCDALPACKARFPSDLREQLRRVMTRLETAPVEVEYRDATTGESRRDTVTDDTLVGLAFAFSYAPETASLLPLVLDEADQGRYAPLMSLAQLMSKSMGDSMNRRMQWSVICAEDADRFDPDASQAGTLLGTEVGEMFFAACAQWPTGARPADFDAPFQSDLPVLLLSGELDPVTPPRYGERVLAGTPNGRHLQLRGQGHGTMGLGCMPKLLGKFIETADAKSLDVDCLDTLTYVPPFTSFNGWEP
jgi:pimeloyl-ACP methyl ester carboxylesterase